MRPMSVLFIISSALLPGVFLATTPSCGFLTFYYRSTVQVKLLFEEKI